MLLVAKIEENLISDWQSSFFVYKASSMHIRWKKKKKKSRENQVFSYKQAVMIQINLFIHAVHSASFVFLSSNLEGWHIDFGVDPVAIGPNT